MTNRIFFIGSLPFSSVERAVAFVGSHSNHLPFLPQLPEANPEEDMYGQMLRGLELGYWDARACSALEAFQNRFSEHKEIKIQAAGPLSLSRMMCCGIESIYPQWLSFWSGMSLHLRQGSIEGKLWLQIDEPHLSDTTPLPASYGDFMKSLRALGEIYRLGLHTCAKARPRILGSALADFEFLSLNYLDQPVLEEDLADVESYLRMGEERQIVAGVMERGEGQLPPWLGRLPQSQTWVSTRCGLYDWSEAEVENRFQRKSQAWYSSLGKLGATDAV